MNSDSRPIVASDKRALVAIDLGAESCRVSLLRWHDGLPDIQLVHRFANHAVERTDGLRWDLHAILEGLDHGLTLCATMATEGIRSVGVDGWAVDYVRLDGAGEPLADPYCYRDERTIAAETALHRLIPADRMRALTGVQLLRINTAYQMFADAPDLRHRRWLNLPEYVLYRLGARPVSERTNASHTQMLGMDGNWCPTVLEALGIPPAIMPELVDPGTDIGRLVGPLAELPPFRNTRLIAPACHDTASAIAAIPDASEDWAYTSSGTWSLVGTRLRHPNNSALACAENFTNLIGAEQTICFHKNVNGMWLLRQCMESWHQQGTAIEISTLIQQAQETAVLPYLLHVDEPDLLLSGAMPQRINTQLRRRSLPELSVHAVDAPAMAALIFRSLAARYAEVLRSTASITGKKMNRIYMMGGGSQNEFLNRLTSEASGLPLHRLGTECSTRGNFVLQLATLESAWSSTAWANALHTE